MKEHTRYEGYNRDSKTIIRFWKVMERFDDEERRKFIRFVWGRSRLPPKGYEWSQRLIIVKEESSDRLPTAHTCSFQIDLLNYSNYKTLETKLRAAINYGLGSMLNN